MKDKVVDKAIKDLTDKLTKEEQLNKGKKNKGAGERKI